jgi:asparagine synthase (glutamine-hydrolysing)
MPRGQRKGLLRAVARKYLPPSIVDRPKQGFAIPIGDWFRTDYGGMKTLLLDTLNSTDPFPADLPADLLGLELNRRFIQRMIDEHMNSRRDHSQRLYMLLVLAIWAKWLRGLNSSVKP